MSISPAYTGNLLFQKEYVVDPISKKTRNNRGELPQYFVENTHEAIIPMEIYQAVQDEKARRRELGVFANWSINTSCFTSKIKCGHCSASHVRNTRRNRAKHPSATDPEMYTTYGCGTRKKKGGKCIGRDIRESILKEKCAEVLGLAEFDEDVFTTQVDKILVPEHGVLVFHMTDGRAIQTEWESTAKKDCWTPERRAAKGKLVHERQLTAHSSCFTSRIRCEMCGQNYRRQTCHNISRQAYAIWRCANGSHCESIALYEDTLRELAAEAMGLTEFSEEAFRKQIAYVGIVDAGKLVFHFNDGHTTEAEWKNKRLMPRQSEERKAHMSMKMKEYWRKRHGESNDHSGNDQPVHSNTD